MKRNRPQFTLGRLMIAVAILAIPLFSVRLLMQRRHHLQLAISYQIREIEAKRRATWSTAMVSRGYTTPEAAAADRARVAYYRRMKAKHNRAVRFPWLPVEPDPPEPR